jgi:hypothetical protein
MSPDGTRTLQLSLSLDGRALVLTPKRFVEAEQTARRSLSIKERALGENHPGVAKSLSSLAEVIYEGKTLSFTFSLTPIGKESSKLCRSGRA